MENEPKKQICQTCGTGFIPQGRDNFACDSCTLAERRAKMEASAEEFRHHVAGAIPALYANTDTGHAAFNAKAWNVIQAHRLTAERPWLGLVGTTGRCKSRIGYMYAKDELARMTRRAMTKEEATNERRRYWDRSSDFRKPTFRLLPSYQFSETVMRQFCDDREDKAWARRELDTLRTVDLLLIDDLGKGKLSPAVIAELHALLDERHTDLRATIWTSNSTPEQIVSFAGFSDDMAAPFARRLEESSTIFTFK